MEIDRYINESSVSTPKGQTEPIEYFHDVKCYIQSNSVPIPNLLVEPTDVE